MEKAKTKKSTCTILWFNTLKGYGHGKDTKTGENVFLYGEIFGGDMWGANIPAKNVPKPGDTFDYCAVWGQVLATPNNDWCARKVKRPRAKAWLTKN